MLQSTARSASRRVLASKLPVNASSTRRLLSTAPPAQKSRSWKSSAVRWAAAGGAVYYYNTSSIFAEEPDAAIERFDRSLHHIQESNLPTVDAIVEEKRQRQAERQAEEARRVKALQSTSAGEEKSVGDHIEDGSQGEESIGDLEDEADQQGAFNPETGEINWDCPCLGGMAHGPCGDEFRAAFSCFVYSKEEPKGMECIDNFKGMQDCFRQHPEMYGSELEDDEDEVEQELKTETAARSSESSSSPVSSSSEPGKPPVPDNASRSQLEDSKPVKQNPAQDSTNASVGKERGGDEGGDLVPKSVLDATSK